jgi:hypothetical protein
LPDLGELAEPITWGRDVARVGALIILAFLPLLFWLLTRGVHHQLDTEAGPLGWLMTTALLWTACALLVLLAGAVEVFGKPWFSKPQCHLRAFQSISGDLLFVIDVFFVLLIAVVFLRAFASAVLGVGTLLASFFEIYALFTVPHLVGVLVRHRRLELAQAYGGSLVG